MSKSYNEKMQMKFDLTVERAVEVLSILIDTCLNKFTSSESSVLVNDLPKLNLFEDLKGSYREFDAGVFKWSNMIGVLKRRDETNQSKNDLFDAILDRLGKKYSEFEIFCEHDNREHTNTLTFCLQFKPQAIVTANEFEEAWEVAKDKMVEYFMGAFNDVITQQCGERSVDGGICINNVMYTDNMVLGVGEGRQIYNKISNAILDNGWVMDYDVSKHSLQRVLYPNVSYDIKLTKV